MSDAAIARLLTGGTKVDKKDVAALKAGRMPQSDAKAVSRA